MATEASPVVETDIQPTHNSAHYTPRAAFVSKVLTQACLRCRKRKVKCSGGLPCSNCRRKRDECAYSNDQKVSISKRHLLQLQADSLRPPQPEQPPQRQVEPNEAHCDSPDSSQVSSHDVVNPLANGLVGSTTDSLGGHHFVGNSSTWGFAWRCRQAISSLLGNESLLGQRYEVDDLAHTRIGESSIDNSTDARFLPQDTVEYYIAQYLYHVAKIWQFVNIKEFTAKLQCDGNLICQIENTPLEKAQFNFIMAIGRLVSGRNISSETRLGESYFSFGLSQMQILNHSKAISQDPITMIQNFCLISFYYHALNMRNDAYVNIGQAMRIAITQGLHRAIEKDPFDEYQRENRVRLWWSLYSLDITLASLMGAPSSIQKSELNVREALTYPNFSSTYPLMCNAWIAQLNAKVLLDVYGSSTSNRHEFLRILQTIFDRLKAIIESMPPDYQLRLEEHNFLISRTAATLHLFAYQVLIVAIRPVLFYSVQMKVKQQSISRSSTAESSPSRGLRGLLKTLTKASVTSLRIIDNLKNQGQLQMHLPFDATIIFSAATIISLMTFTSTESMDESLHVNEAINLLKEIGDNGNLASRRWKDELETLSLGLNISKRTHILESQVQDNGTTYSDNSTPNLQSLNARDLSSIQETLPSLQQDSPPDYFNFSGDISYHSMPLSEVYFTENIDWIYSQPWTPSEILPLGL